MNQENLSLLTTQKLTTGCPILDTFLGGGIPCRSITEITAESGSGKTQLCLQLLLSAQLPPSLGGLSASSLFLHSDRPFPLRRLRHLSSSLPNSPLHNIFPKGVYSAHEMAHLMPKIESFVESRSGSDFPVRLIVVDSIAALFRCEFENNGADLKRRLDVFFRVSGRLKRLATRFGIAVVVTNQVVDLIVETVRVGNFGAFWSSGRRVSPALGIGWAHCVNTRLFMSRNSEGGETRRRIFVVFAPHLPHSSCEFVIRREGVFGIEG